jgi:tetratricopeptide (TPR) repeat protein
MQELIRATLMKVDADAIALVNELDGLPLALSTAGAYLEHVTTTFSDYLRLYKASWLQLQKMSPQLGSYEDRSLYTTWQITFDRIQQRNPASARLLKLWAYFDRQDVWFELIQKECSAFAYDEWIQKLAEDELSFNHAVRLLCEFGLAYKEPSPQQVLGSEGYSMHSCVHTWTEFVLNQEWDESLAKLALSCVASMVPDTIEDKWWLLGRRLLQHAARHEHWIEDGKADFEGMEWELYRLGDLYSDQGKFAEGETMYLRGLHLSEAVEPSPRWNLAAINNLANVYSDQGRLAEAEAMGIRALRGKEETYGLKHASTLFTVNTLGIIYMYQGRPAEAEAMFTRALRGREEALGPKHILTHDTVHNLGELFYTQGRLTEAEAMFSQALQGTEEALGPNQPSTIYTLCHLGNVYRRQQKLVEAETMIKRALEGLDDMLGSKHDWTLLAVYYSGLLYFDQGKLVEAETMYSRALQGYEEAVGLGLESHVPALRVMCDLGDLFSKTGRKDMAKTMYSRALSGFTTVQGPSSEWCRQIEDRLQTLQLIKAENKA